MRLEILVPHDLGPAADDALGWAERLVRASGGSIDVLHVVSFVPPLLSSAPVAGSGPLGSDDLEGYRTAVMDRVRGLGVPTHVEVTVAADIGEAIVLRARRRGADMVVMGTHGRNPFARALLGSIADYVTRHADCPVLTVRHKPVQEPVG
ncbi:MAG: universal stress protein [Deltaproteobacteria bacterium]